MNTDLSGPAITLAVLIEQVSVARAHRSRQLPAPCVAEVRDVETIPAAGKEHLLSLLRETRHAAVTALPALYNTAHRTTCPALTPRLPADIILTIN
ncbi:hypothetical protein [Janthinobacterium sp. JC611]|uniref:hypothetical protein n=1 Tax=Janthinobacterium sp. JC611 TaxID=2816201 RepID=UPI001BFE5ED2|nr:hypothetical protein [Janthinobacterium sp. JC611]